MKTKLTPIAAAAAVALAGAMAPTFAQTAAAPAAAASAPAASDVQTVEVTGIRASLQSAINQKRNADSHVEVITSEDVGKMPDKNVADSLRRLPGVTTGSAGANEGGFDEADRVSMRGTSPSLTQTLINGHNVATGDWFVLDQTGTVGRSVSYTLLPSEIIGSVVVHKSSEASLVEGGVAGSVDILTRKPLEFKKPFSASVNVGAVYADLPSKTDPQVNGLVNWKNEEGTFGVLLQGFYEKRHLRRDGIEVLGYDTIQATDPAATAGLPGLTAGVKYPDLIGEALFEQERKRVGGTFDVEVKPNDSTTLDLNGFLSNMTATNINRNYMFYGRKLGSMVPTSYTVQNGYLTSATYEDSAGMPVGIYDQISRPGEGARSQYFDFDGKFDLSSKLTLKTQLGSSTGYGKTPEQDVAETVVGGTAASFQLNGAGAPASFSFPNSTSNSQGSVGLNSTYNTDSGDGWIFGDQNLKVNDGEKWAQLDAQYNLEAGPLVDLKFGVRGSQHKRSLWGAIGQGPTVDWSLPDLAAACASGTDFRCIPAASGSYPSNFASGLGANVPAGVWTYSPAQLAAYDAQYTTRDPVTRADYGADYGLREADTAAYIQGDLEGDQWSGNVGLRVVNTKEHIQDYVEHNSAQPGDVTSAFGSFGLTTTDHSYTDLLPSLNLKYNLNKSMVARFAASRTMTRADYSQLAGTVTLNAVDDVNRIGTGSGGNPDLKPVVSNNVDATFEWYPASRAIVSASAFFMDVTSYIGLSAQHRTLNYINNANPNGVPIDFTLTVPTNIAAKVHGLEFAWEQPVWGNFGVQTNYAWTTSSTEDHSPMVGTSRNTYNVGGYFENDVINARVSFNHRSAFYSGLDRSTAYYQAGTGALSASLGWTIDKHFSVSLDGNNLNKPKLKYYESGGEPRAIYQNGAQYYVTAHYNY